MSLTQALSTSTAGLRTTQAALALIASNVANAETPGYVRKTLVQATSAAGGNGVSVRVAEITREFDQYIQRQLRVETAGGSYADKRAEFYSRLQQVYGTPGSDAALETVFNKFTDSLQALTTSPDSIAARAAVLSAAQVLAQQLNSMTTDIQALRSDAELGLGDAVARANNAMQQIAAHQPAARAAAAANDAATATLLDQRDIYIDELSRLMDIKVVKTDHNQINIFTNSGIQLVGVEASQLSFDAQGTVTPSALWDRDPAKRTVGTLTLCQSDRRRDGPDRQRRDPVRRDRGLSRNARHRAGAGADPARPDRRRDVVGACRTRRSPARAVDRRSRSRVSTSIPPACSPATRSI